MEFNDWLIDALLKAGIRKPDSRSYYSDKIRLTWGIKSTYEVVIVADKGRVDLEGWTCGTIIMDAVRFFQKSYYPQTDKGWFEELALKMKGVKENEETDNG